MINSIWPASISIKRFRNFRDINFSLGRKITLISGQNGSGKSNLLSLIASASGQNQKSALGSNFQPDFNDFFAIDKSENYKEYSLFVDFYDQDNHHVLRKNLTFKDDTDSNRGIRIIPRTVKFLEDDTRRLREVEKEAKEKYGVGGAARVPIPTIYLSISRLYPLGEKKDIISIKEYAKTNSLYQKNVDVKFAEWYNSVIPNSIITDSQLSLIEKNKISKRASFHMDMNHTPALSQSIGQDNLGNIISALVDVYLLSQEEGYKGALVCIDEIDVSLHPDTQIRLLTLMDHLADELSIQFILTTHSLTFLKEISRLEKKSHENYRIVYLKNPSIPYVEQRNDYYAIKADLFNKLSYNPPKVKVYFEDNVGMTVFQMLLSSLEVQVATIEGEEGYLRDRGKRADEYNKRLLNLRRAKGIIKKLNLIPVELGCDELVRLSSVDTYFKRIIIILDGDARIKNGKDVHKPEIRDYLDKWYTANPDQDRKCSQNICFLPGYFAPESFLYKIIYILIKNQADDLMFWRSLDQYEETAMYTPDKMKEAISTLSGDYTNDDIKKLFDNSQWKIKEFVKKTKLLDYYFGSYKTIEPLIEFWENFFRSYDMAEPLTLQNRYS